MEVFVGNLPASFTDADLNRLFNRFGRRSKFRVVRRREGAIGSRRFGLGIIQPARAARRAIRRCDGIAVGGRRLRVRPYVRRTANRERRRPDWRARPWPYPERRRTERRRPGSIIRMPSPRFESSGFAQPRMRLVCINGDKGR